MSQVKIGIRLRCGACGSECIVTKPGESALECCDAPLTVTFEPSG